MKKYISIIPLIVILLMSNTINTYELALESPQREIYIENKFDDGSYIEITLEEYSHIEKSSTRSGSKTRSYKNSNGKTIWSLKVNGDFTFNGKTASCTKATSSVTSNTSLWKFSNKSASKSGATA